MTSERGHKVPGRPHVIVNMAISVDGRITTRRREQIALGTRHDRHLMDVLRARVDGVIVGAGTVRHDGYPVLVRDPNVRRRTGAGRSPHPVNVVLSRGLDLPLNRPIFERGDIHRLIYTTRAAPAARRRRFEKVAEVVVLPTKGIAPSTVLRDLYARGMKRVLMEGGGELHFAFAREHVVDEIYVTVTPRLIGGDAPSLLDGKGFLKKDHLKLKLVSTRRVDDELFLRYRVLYD
jgi:2,5-diamino-6-(ribosylamino)-4(3H)-pyrimidinone 5'-phosphate reductase